MSTHEPRFTILHRISTTLGIPPASLRSAGYRGAHGTRAQARARAAVCWAIREKLGLSYQDIGEVVGLKHTSVRRALLSAPKLFTADELEAFRGAA
jgi:chromosomal replication initiation ATPase DnaA